MASKAVQIAQQQLHDAMQTLNNEEGFQRFLKARSTLHNYSMKNMCLIFMQHPTATVVRGRKQWLNDFHRTVVSKTKPIWILAPVTRKNDEGVREVVAFKGVRVFDVSDTYPDPDLPTVPLHPPIADLAGDSHSAAIPKLERFAADKGSAVIYEDLPENRKGSFNRETRAIEISKSLSPNHKVKTLMHELAHALTERLDERSSPEREVIAEAAAYCACSAINLDTGSYSVGYCATWAGADSEALAKVAGEIETIATLLAQNAETPGQEPGVPEAPSTTADSFRDAPISVGTQANT